MIHIWSKVFISTISTHDSDLGVEVRILKMLKFSFTFLRPYYFLTISPNWFIFGLMNILHIAIPPHPSPPPHPRSCQNQDHGRIFQKQNVQYQTSYPVWRQVLFYILLASGRFRGGLDSVDPPPLPPPPPPTHTLESKWFHFHGEFLENIGKMVESRTHDRSDTTPPPPQPLSKFESPVQKSFIHPCYQLTCLKIARWGASSVEPEQMPHSVISKTRLFKYIENFTTKNWKFLEKSSDIFMFLLKT